MFLRELKISGYKCFGEPIVVGLSQGLNVLVGENGAGKSAIVDAIRLLLGEEESLRQQIREGDFHRQSRSAQAPRLSIKGRFSGLSEDQKVALLPWMTKAGEAAISLTINNRQSRSGRYHRQRVFGMSTSAAQEPELLDFFDCVYLPPLRDAEARLREGKASRLAKLLKDLERGERRKNGAAHPLEVAVQDFNSRLADDSTHVISRATQLIQARLREMLGPFFSQDAKIQFSEASFTKIAEALRLFFLPNVKDQQSFDFQGLEENSLGYNNLLYFATVLAELESLDISSASAVEDEPDDTKETPLLRLLLVEEPEAHLHPQLQIRLMRYLQQRAVSSSLQIIVTTHSPLLASSAQLNSLVHVSRSLPLGHFQITPLHKLGVPDRSLRFLQRWLDATKSALLFARGVILVEGIAEAVLVPELAKIVLRQQSDRPEVPLSLDEYGVSVVPMNGVYFKHFMSLFCKLHEGQEHYLPIRCAGLTDNDPRSPEGRKKNYYPCEPTAGANPALALIPEINQSSHARIFHSPIKTFEYDLALAGNNLPIMAKAIAELCSGSKREQAQSVASMDWTNATPVEKGSAARELLKSLEKGLFAQHLADNLPVETGGQATLTVPEYIRQGVLWVCGLGSPIGGKDK